MSDSSRERNEHEELPQWHPGAQIRSGHPEDAAVQVDYKKTELWKQERGQ
jgi:hypothetical protein